jgi:hypothetical protein
MVMERWTDGFENYEKKTMFLENVEAPCFSQLGGAMAPGRKVIAPLGPYWLGLLWVLLLRLNSTLMRDSSLVRVRNTTSRLLILERGSTHH